jgi:hypothetical protein
MFALYPKRRIEYPATCWLDDEFRKKMLKCNKRPISWDVRPYSLTEVHRQSEERTASIFRFDEKEKQESSKEEAARFVQQEQSNIA